MSDTQEAPGTSEIPRHLRHANDLVLPVRHVKIYSAAAWFAAQYSLLSCVSLKHSEVRLDQANHGG